jgi:hypothetical protein
MRVWSLQHSLCQPVPRIRRLCQHQVRTNAILLIAYPNGSLQYRAIRPDPLLWFDERGARWTSPSRQVLIDQTYRHVHILPVVRSASSIISVTTQPCLVIPAREV